MRKDRASFVWTVILIKEKRAVYVIVCFVLYCYGISLFFAYKWHQIVLEELIESLKPSILKR